MAALIARRDTKGIAVLKTLFFILMTLVALGLIYTTITSMSHMFT